MPSPTKLHSRQFRMQFGGMNEDIYQQHHSSNIQQRQRQYHQQQQALGAAPHYYPHPSQPQHHQYHAHQQQYYPQQQQQYQHPQQQYPPQYTHTYPIPTRLPARPQPIPQPQHHQYHLPAFMNYKDEEYVNPYYAVHEQFGHDLDDVTHLMDSMKLQYHIPGGALYENSPPEFVNNSPQFSPSHPYQLFGNRQTHQQQDQRAVVKPIPHSPSRYSDASYLALPRNSFPPASRGLIPPSPQYQSSRRLFTPSSPSQHSRSVSDGSVPSSSGGSTTGIANLMAVQQLDFANQPTHFEDNVNNDDDDDDEEYMPQPGIRFNDLNDEKISRKSTKSPWSKSAEGPTPDKDSVAHPFSYHFGFPSIITMDDESSDIPVENTEKENSFFASALFPGRSAQNGSYQRAPQQYSSEYGYAANNNIVPSSYGQHDPLFSPPRSDYESKLAFTDTGSQYGSFNSALFGYGSTPSSLEDLEVSELTDRQHWADSIINASKSSNQYAVNVSSVMDPNLSHKATTNNNNNPTVSAASALTAAALASQSRRPELLESPVSKMKYKDFARNLKLLEKEGYEKARNYSIDALRYLPPKVHWRVCMDIADLAKRENIEKEARQWYKTVNKLQPYAPQGWLEHAKMEEECGRLEQCQKILSKGLQYCPYNESLLVKAIKHQEAMNNLPAARALLARLKNVCIEKTWKTMMEGALMEARDGKVVVARKVFKYLMASVPRHGPIYQEAYKLEEKCEEFQRALEIVERGLAANPRYGPLWFAAFHLYERLALQEKEEKNLPEVDLTRVRDAIKKATTSISKELVWKVHFESAQIEERAGNLANAKRAYVESVLNCLPNLRWKVWLAGARTELNGNNIANARKLLNKALSEVPNKTRAVVLIECARLEEFAGNLDKARQILKRAQKETKHEWKVFLESILLEMRAGDTARAIEEANAALEIHRGTGRLWAVLIQLKHIDGETEQLRVFKEALREVPKSGEVWCEGARIRLNPLSSKFCLKKAQKYLRFAIKFTPQYGDSFIEYLRVELLTQGPEPQNKTLEQLCVNADPNYGPMWFHCKQHPLDSTRQVLRRAKEMLSAELVQYRHLYQLAIIRSTQQPSTSSIVSPSSSGSNSNALEGSTSQQPAFQQQQVPAQSYRTEDGQVLTAQDFITGLHSLNDMYKNARDLDDVSRRKIIFGSDQISV